MRHEEIEGRLQNLEVSMQAILLRLKFIEDGLRPKSETVAIVPEPEKPVIAESLPDVAGAVPPVIVTPDLPIAPATTWRDTMSTRMPDYMRENLEAERTNAERAQAEQVRPAASSPFNQPKAPPSTSRITIPPAPTAEDIEYKFGINGLLRGGAAVIVLAILFFVAIMIGRGALTRPVQFAGEIVTCFAFIGIGIWKRNEREDFGQLMVGIGSFGLYASFAAGYAYKHLYEGEPLVAMYTLLSLANLGFAQWRSSKSFLIIGMLGGLVAAMMPMHKDKVLLDFALHFLILAPCAAIIVRNKWNGMAGLMWVVSTAALIPATTSHFEQFWRVGATYLNCAIALYACGKVFEPTDFDKHAAIQTIMLVLTGFFAIGIDTGHQGSLHAVVLTAVAAGIGYALQENVKARNATWLGGLIVFAIMTPMGNTQGVAAFWYAIEALALVYAAIHFRLVALWAVSLSTFIFSNVAYLYFADKGILSLARFSPPLELLFLAISSVTVVLNIRYALPNKMKEIQDVAMLVGGGILAGFFVRALNVILGNGNTSLHIGAINTLALAIASVAALVLANRFQRLAIFVLGAFTAVGSYLFYLIASPDGSFQFIWVAPPLDLCLLALFSVSVGLAMRFTLARTNRDFQEATIFVGSNLLVAVFVRAINVLAGSGHTGAVTAVSAAIASIGALVVANRVSRLSVYVAGSIATFWSVAYYLVRLSDSELTFVRMAPSLELFMLVCLAAAASLNIRFLLRRDNKNVQEIALFAGGSAMLAIFVRGLNIVLGNGNTTMHVEDINSLGIGLAGLMMVLVAVASKRKGLLAFSAIVVVWLGVLALMQDPETAPHWLSPALVVLAAGCVLIGSKSIIETQDKSYEEPLMVFAGLALSAFFVRLMHLAGINHLLNLTKDASTYFSFGLLNIIWTAFALRNRRAANLVLAWASFAFGVCAGATLPVGSGPSWLSPMLLGTPLVALGILYAITPRKEAEEGPVTAICAIAGWYLSTVFLRQELMRPWIGLNHVASYTAAWVIFAVFLITAGFKADRRFLRYWSLLVFGVTVCKVFLVDLSELDSVIRVAMLTILGLGMMGGGYWYILWRRSHTATEPQIEKDL